jgi:hypothetical protein
MRIYYHLLPLSQRDRDFVSMVLLEEIEIQSWFTVTISSVINEEVLLTLQ